MNWYKGIEVLKRDATHAQVSQNAMMHYHGRVPWDSESLIPLNL